MKYARIAVVITILSVIFVLTYGANSGHAQRKPPPPRDGQAPPPPDTASSGQRGSGSSGEAVHVSTSSATSGSVAMKGEAWADNWFAFYLGDTLVVEDSVPITTERSFNAEAFTFHADYPMMLNLVIKDFKENDSGLEYIGTQRQQMGDGGFIAQFTDTATGEVVAVTNAGWKCLVVHEAPLDTRCAKNANPVAGQAPCDFVALDEPEGWKSLDFDDDSWQNATEYTTSQVRPKDGYNQISWDRNAGLIWTSDLETHNTILCRRKLEKP